MVREETFVSRTLSSGLEVHSLKRSVPWVRLALSVEHAGHYFDPLGKEGAAHLLEHVLHSGTKGYVYREFHQLRDWLEEQPFSLVQATTYMECMRFLFIVDALRAEEGLTFLRDFVCRPSFCEDLERDREIVRRERVQNAPVPRAASITSARAHAFGLQKHRSHTATGLPQDDVLNAITLDDIQVLHSQFFHPRNMILIAVGGMGDADLDAVLERVFEKSVEPRMLPLMFDVPPPQLPKKREDRFGPQGEGVVTCHHVTYEWLIPRSSIEASILARNVLHRVLLEEVREKRQLAYHVNVSSVSSCYKPDSFLISCSVKPEQESVVRSLIEEIVDDVPRLLETIPLVTKNAGKDLLFMERNAFDAIGRAYTDLEVYGRIKTLSGRIQSVIQMKREDVEEMIRRHLDPANAYIRVVQDL